MGTRGSVIFGLSACECPKGNWALRWPVTPSGWVQCQWCGGLRYLGVSTVRDHVRTWIIAERALYADAKWSPPENSAAHNAAVREQGPTKWSDWAGNYIKRATMFGLDSPQGRQALGKAVVTLIHVLETAVELYGPMPEPGYPSGEVR